MAVRGTQNSVSRGRRMQNLQENVEKIAVKEERTYRENNVLFVHRSKKRARLSHTEKLQV